MQIKSASFLLQIAFLLLVVICTLISGNTTWKIKCYQCTVVTTPCTVEDAAAIQCSVNSSCAMEVPVNAATGTAASSPLPTSVAIRKCVIPPKHGNVPCPSGYQCGICASNLCNSASSFQRFNSRFIFGMLSIVFTVVLYT